MAEQPPDPPDFSYIFDLPPPDHPVPPDVQQLMGEAPPTPPTQSPEAERHDPPPEG